MNDWEDRYVDSALQELHGSKPPDLSARIVMALQEQPQGPLPRLVPSPASGAPGMPPTPASANAATNAALPPATGTAAAAASAAAAGAMRTTAPRFTPWSLVAALLVAIGVGFGVAFAAIQLGAVPRDGRSPSVDSFATWVEVASGRVECVAGGVVQAAGVAGGPRAPFVAAVGNRLQCAVPSSFVLGTFGRFEARAESQLEVRSMEFTKMHGVFVASSLTLAVVAGVVTWHALTHTETAKAGEVLHVTAGDGGNSATLVAENTQLRQRLDELERQNESLRAAAVQRDAAPVVKPPVVETAAAPPPATPAAAGMAFTDPKFADALAKIDWQAMGATTKEMGPLLAQLMGAMAEGDDKTIVELAGKVQELNGKLVAQVPAMMEAGLPGFGGNGFYTHPLVAANILSSTLNASGSPLSAAQKQSIDGLVASFARENQSIVDAPREFDLEHLLAEGEMKDRFYKEVGGVLAPEQYGAIFVEGGGTYAGGGLFSSGLMEQGVASPIPAKDAAEFARNASRKIQDELDLDDATATQVRSLLEHHSAAPELWRDRGDATEKKLGMMRTGRMRTALRHQLEWMRMLQQQVALTPEQKKKLAKAKVVFVPLPN
jgi:hypothetical protein